MAVASRRKSVRTSWRELRPYIGSSTGKLYLLGATAILSGFIEAGLMVAIVRIAIGLADSSKLIKFESMELTLNQLFWISGAFLVLGFGVSTINSWLTARLSADALTIARRLTFRDFVAASWSLQSQEREGHLQEIMSNHVGRVCRARP